MNVESDNLVILGNKLQSPQWGRNADILNIQNIATQAVALLTENGTHSVKKKNKTKSRMYIKDVTGTDGNIIRRLGLREN